jgi:hypothetical protein
MALARGGTRLSSMAQAAMRLSMVWRLMDKYLLTNIGS